MRIVGLSKDFYYLSKNRPIAIGPIAQQRLQWLTTWQRLRAEGFTSAKAAELVGIPRSTLYRWQKRLEDQGARGLEDGDRRPKNVRRPQWSPELVEAVLSLREAVHSLTLPVSPDSPAGLGGRDVMLLVREGPATIIFSWDVRVPPAWQPLEEIAKAMQELADSAMSESRSDE